MTKHICNCRDYIGFVKEAETQNHPYTTNDATVGQSPMVSCEEQKPPKIATKVDESTLSLPNFKLEEKFLKGIREGDYVVKVAPSD